ncbi:MAG TPA: alanine racemase [Bryobacteraceae bacterium]|nr:alanine racemase [Bryobacteraceae bacterium]
MTCIQDLDTPALIVDLDIMERNLRRVSDYCAAHNLRLRPHTKTHKSILVARQQLALGAAGLTVAKTGEAEVMLGAEPRDLLVAYPVVGEAKLRRLAAVAGVTRVTVALDSLISARQLSRAAEEAGVRFGVLTEIDVGLARVGVQPSEALDLARAMAALPGLEWRGITFYPGHIKDQNAEKLAELSRTIGSIRDEFVRAGLAPEIVSGGSTPALYHSHEIEGLNEIRPGTYVFNDLNTVASGACALEDCAASVLVTVVSHTRPERMIVDGGSKTFSSDKLSSGGPGHGRVVEAPGASFHKMNEEHGFIDVSKAERSFEIGEKVRIIPNHICVVVNLHEYVYGVRGGKVEEVWNVEGRGKLQ